MRPVWILVTSLVTCLSACSGSGDVRRQRYPFEYVDIEREKEGRPENAGALYFEPTRIELDGGSRWQLGSDESLGVLSLFITSHLQASFLAQGYTVVESLDADIVLEELVHRSRRSFEQSQGIGKRLGHQTLVLTSARFRWSKDTGPAFRFELEGVNLESAKRVLFTSDPMFASSTRSLLAILSGIAAGTKNHNNLIISTGPEATPDQVGDIAVVAPRYYYGFEPSNPGNVDDWVSQHLLETGFSLVDRAHVQDVMSHQQSMASRIYQDQSRIKLGRLLGADALLFTDVGGGHLNVLDDSDSDNEEIEDPGIRFFTQRLVRVQDGKVLAALSGIGFAHQSFQHNIIDLASLFVASLKMGTGPEIHPYATEEELSEIAASWLERACGH